MIQLLIDLLCALLDWNHDPDIDGVRGRIALIFLLVFVVLVILCAGTLVAIR